MSEEIWKKYDDYIEVSSLGRVRSLDTKHYYKHHGETHRFKIIRLKEKR